MIFLVVGLFLVFIVTFAAALRSFVEVSGNGYDLTVHYKVLDAYGNVKNFDIIHEPKLRTQEHGRVVFAYLFSTRCYVENPNAQQLTQPYFSYCHYNGTVYPSSSIKEITTTQGPMKKVTGIVQLPLFSNRVYVDEVLVDTKKV